MSAKRKNVPTKLATDDVFMQSETPNNVSDSDSMSDSDCESDSSMSLHIVTKPEADHDSHSDTSSPGSERPQSKKARILQSVKCDNESDDSDSVHMNNNYKTRPNGGLPINSVDPVLKKVSRNEVEHQKNGMVEEIQKLLGPGGNVSEKERQLSEMISQLQSLKESLCQDKVSFIEFLLFQTFVNCVNFSNKKLVRWA